MKLATLFTIFAYAAAGKNRPTVIEIYNEHGQVAIVNDENAAREGKRFQFNYQIFNIFILFEL